MKFKKLARKYQKKAIRFLLKKENSGLFLDMGLGKTAIILAYISQIIKENPEARFLIIAPLRVIYSVWPNEIKDWEDFNHLTYLILHGKDKNKLVAEKANIYLINPEGLQWYFKQRTHKCIGLIIDESTKFKNWMSKRMKLLKKYLKNFKYRHILTGSPTPNSLQDLFSQIYILDEGLSLGSYITHYRNNHFYQIPIPGTKASRYELIPGAEVEIYNKVKKLVLRMDSKDYLDLPGVINNNIFLEMDKKTEKVYKQMEEELLIELDKRKTIMAKTVTDKIGKCRQVLSGAIYNDLDRTDYSIIHEIKMDALKDIIDDLNGNPLIVVYEFRHELDRFKKEFGKDIPFIGGGSKNSEDIVEAWNYGLLPILFIHPKSAAHGLNLQKGGHHLLWYSMTWSWEDYAQVIKRLDRSGQTSSVHNHRLLFKDSLDTYICRKVQKKKSAERDLLDFLK